MKLGSILFIVVLLMASAALGQDCPTPALLQAGWDLWESGRDGDMFPPAFFFGTDAAPPIPADFFGPGSDPFAGLIGLTGDPLSGSFGLADAIVERLAPVLVPDPGSPAASTPIELVALSLVSTSPIIVTYNGGQNPQEWDVKVCLSDLATSPGTMDIVANCCEGGTFQTQLQIMPKFTFTLVSSTFSTTMDWGLESYQYVPWDYDGSWAVEPSPPNIPGPVQIDADCNAATPDITVGPSPELLVTGGTGTPWFGDPCSACPDLIAAGHDLWESGRDGDIFPPAFFFGTDAPPIPADFFGPGSDPFAGAIGLTGDPFQTTPSGAFGLADAIVQRSAPTTIPDPGSPVPQPIAIELVALSLISVAPITITYNGGQDPEEWVVKVCLSEAASSPGFMDISADCCEGGTFHAELDIMPRFTFTRVSDVQETVLDWSWGYTAVPWTYDGRWAVEPSPPNIPGPVQVDHDCSAATADIVVGPTPRLLVTGGTGTPWFGDPCDVSACPDPIAAGHDLWESGRDGDIFPPTFNFGYGLTAHAPGIPADFFGPGSDPFEGQIGLTGDPFTGAFGLADAIVERPAPAAIPDPLAPPNTIAIELVALSLISVQPITVTYNGGQDPEEWDVKVCLSDAGSSPGTMDISAGCCEGGTFQAELNITPRFTFTRVSDAQVSTLDFYWEVYPTVPWTYDGSWAVEASPPDIPGPVQIDHDCYATTPDIVVGPSPRLLVTGGTGEPWFGDPCYTGCCVDRVGDANNSGEDEPSIGDVAHLVDHLFIDKPVLVCVAEADINQSGGIDPSQVLPDSDITIGDVADLVDYLFIATPEFGTLRDCL